ncbi:urea carboxylase-associated family protein [Actinomadura sp. B10D3]|uniref:urea carboxylase-associated family protein n=1 Tax=Actinomadura sp. B10D3 TaxID=3153557 RepID=UPI00325D50CC
MTRQLTTVGAGDVGTFRVASGQTIEVVNTFGGQVVDAWFFAAGDPAGFASMSHSRASLRTIRPVVGSTFVTRRREPLITLIADSSPGVHDMTMPPCDRWRYQQLGAPEHRNCADNLRSALRAEGHGDVEVLPDPLNLFQNSPIDGEGRLTFLESPAPAGSSVSLRALRDLVAHLSVCPMDIMPINGGAPRSIGVAVLDPDEAR